MGRTMTGIPGPFEPPARILMGPGPSNVHPRVLHAMSNPVIGHLDPACLQMLDEIQAMLCQAFQTTNGLTYPVSGTGTAAMETALTNVLEPGDVAVVVVSGAFAERMAEIARRCGAEVVTVGERWGHPVEASVIDEALQHHPGAKALCAVHAETSTGVRQPLEEIGTLARSHGALFLVDAVASLGGIEVQADGWQIDVCYSGSQKCLSAPPGLGPITFSDRAFEARQARRQPPPSFYLDAALIRRYFGQERLYHHTAPVSMLYALHEALRLVLEEGLEARWRRHEQVGAELLSALEDRGFRPVPPEGYRLPQLAVVEVPDGLDDKATRARLLTQYGIEVGGGLGEFAGRVWRVGIMGESGDHENVKALTSALDELL
jgi:alanine-glyoxylate transaminase / serine-glyoxylate transaminase / serine-pyruvate transaminase